MLSLIMDTGSMENVLADTFLFSFAGEQNIHPNPKQARSVDAFMFMRISRISRGQSLKNLCAALHFCANKLLWMLSAR